MNERQTIGTLRKQLVSGQITAVERIGQIIDKIRKEDQAINAFITLDEEGALAQAKKIDEQLQAGEEVGPLAGIPVALKDNISTIGLRTTCASKMLEDYVPPFDAEIVTKLKEAGAIIVGKTNMDEFAMGATTESSFFGVTKNPLDLTRVPGGSSGGSAAAVAADMVPVAIGSDTGGSIRQPAAYCGVYGIKPTYGSVSRNGVVAFASSLDQIGPLAHSVEDLGILLNVLTGHDPGDSTSLAEEYPDYTARLQDGVAGLRIGVPQELMSDDVDEAVRETVKNAAAALEKQGAVVETCSLPTIAYSIPAYYLIATAEASSNLARFDGVRYGLRVPAEDMIAMFKKTRQEGFGAEVKRRIMLGTYALSAGYYDAYYLKALKVRHLLQDDFMARFETFDCLLAPATVQVAPKMGEQLDAVKVYQQDICTCPANLAGLPALSMPYGRSEGLPVGIQLIGPSWSEPTLLQIAQALQEGA